MRKVRDDRYDVLRNALGENIKTLSMTKKWNEKPVSTLADLCGVTQSNVSNWIAGRSLPNVLQLSIIAEYFGVTMEWLIKKHTKEELMETIIDRKDSD